MSLLLTHGTVAPYFSQSELISCTSKCTGQDVEDLQAGTLNCHREDNRQAYQAYLISECIDKTAFPTDCWLVLTEAEKMPLQNMATFAAWVHYRANTNFILWDPYAPFCWWIDTVSAPIMPIQCPPYITGFDSKFLTFGNVLLLLPSDAALILCLWLPLGRPLCSLGIPGVSLHNRIHMMTWKMKTNAKEGFCYWFCQQLRIDVCIDTAIVSDES